MTLSRRTPTARTLGIACCTFVAFLALHAKADAAPVTFSFVTEDAGTPFGHGGFVFDDTLFPYPYKVIGVFPHAPDVFLDFWYTDPFIGTFGKENVSSSHFEIGIDPNTGLWSPTISLWAFVIATDDLSRVMIGSVSGDDPNGHLNTNLFRDDFLTPSIAQVKQVTVFFPQPVPEPGTMLLLSLAFAAFTRRRH